MAMEGVLSFWEKVGENEELRSKFEAGVEPRSGWDAIVAFANSNGFDITTADYAEAVEALPKDLSADGYQAWKSGDKAIELGEEELEQVAGGIGRRSFSIFRKASSPLRFGNTLRGRLQPFGKKLPGGGFGPAA